MCGLASTCCTPLRIQPFVLLLIRCLHDTVLLDIFGLDRTAVGMDVDEAAGVENRRYTPMSSGSARSAALETGGVVQSECDERDCGVAAGLDPSEKLQSWRRR